MRHVRFLWVMVLLATSMVAGGAAGDDHDRVKQLFDRGEIVALERIIADVRQHFGGRILAVEFEREDGRYVYEIEILDVDGRVREFYYDAKTGAFIKEED